MSTRVRSRWVMVVLAAARLAALYAAGVLLLATPVFLLLTNQLTHVWEALAATPIMSAFGFLAGFIALAVARRVGFAILWLLLLLLWVGISSNMMSFAIGMAFMLWSLFAVPLYVLGAIAFTTRYARLEITAVLGVWAILTFLGMQPPEPPASVVNYPNYDYLTPASWTLGPIGSACLVWPFLVVARELIRIVREFRAPRDMITESADIT